MELKPNLYDATYFYSLCNLMADYHYGTWRNNQINVRKIKMLSNQLAKELEKPIDVLFKTSGRDDFTDVADQFINATESMEKFFKLGLKMDELDDPIKNELMDKLNAIIKEYLGDYETR